MQTTDERSNSSPVFSIHPESISMTTPKSGRSSSSTFPTGASPIGSPSFYLHSTMGRRNGSLAPWRVLGSIRTPQNPDTSSWDNSLLSDLPVPTLPSYLKVLNLKSQANMHMSLISPYEQNPSM
jgi:hypothetical protein